MRPSRRPSPRLAGAALTIGLVTTGCGSHTIAIDPPSADATTLRVCERLVDALPDSVADQPRRAVRQAGERGAAWGDPAIVLTCGVGEPEGFDEASGCTTVDGVDWFIPVEQLEGNGSRDLVMTTIKRRVLVEVRMPGEYWPPATSLADLSGVVRTHTEATGSCF